MARKEGQQSGGVLRRRDGKRKKKKRDPVEKRSVLFTSMSYRDGQSADCVIAACFADDKLMLPGIYYGRRKSGCGDGGDMTEALMRA